MRWPIPVRAARKIAEEFGYDQVIIIARKVGENGGEHCTTYGVNKANCEVAAKIGDFLKFKVMGWVAAGEGSAMKRAKHRGLKTGLDDGPPNSICMCANNLGLKCPIHAAAGEGSQK